MSRFARNTAVFSALTMVSRVTGLLRLMAFTYAISVQTSLADAYNLANVIPHILYEFIVGGMLSAIFIPLLVREQEAKGKNSAEAWGVANLLLGTVGFILAATSLLAIVGAPYLVQALTFFGEDEVSPERRELATTFLRFFAPQMVFYGLSAVFMAVLNSHNVFAITAAAPIINNVVVIATLLAYRFGHIGIIGLAVGSTAGIVAMALVQVPWLFKIGMPLRPKVSFTDPVFRSATALGLPVAGVAVANLLGTVVRTNFLSTVLGGLTAFTICFTLIMMPYGIFAVAIATVLYPALSRAAAEGNMAEYGRTLGVGFRWTTYIMLPVAVGLSVLALPITRALFEHRGGEFSYADAVFTSEFLTIYAYSILPYSLVILATRGFYSLKNTRTPAWINLLGVVVNTVTSYFLLRVMGIPGVALAAVVTYAFTTVLSLVMLREHVELKEVRRFVTSSARMALAGAVMGFAIYSVGRYTAPEVVVLQRGSRLPLRLPASAAGGNAVLFNRSDDWVSLQKHLQLHEKAVPPVNFQRESIVLVIGPTGATTSSLDLKETEITSDGLHLSLHVRKGGSAVGADAPTSPSYMLLKVNRPLATVTQKIEVQGGKRGITAILAALTGEVARLGFLVVLGGFLYVVTSILLGITEPWSLLKRLRSRNRPSPPPPTESGNQIA